jgi:alanine racemase
VAVDDEVTLIGEQQGEVLTADDMARDSATISYEVLTGIMARVPRAYVRGGQIVAWQDLTGYHEA